MTGVAAGGVDGPRHARVWRQEAGLLKFAAFAVVAYTHLWIVEGAFRKWVPGVGDVLYVGRDALALAAILVLAAGRIRERRSIAVFWIALLLLAALAGIAGLLSGLPPAVLVAGIRSYIAPFLIPVIIFCYRPPGIMRRVSRAVLVYVPLQLVLGIAQISNPPTSWVNTEVSGEQTRFLNDGIARMSGTFTAPSGLTLYVALAFAIALGWYLGDDRARRRISRPILLALGLLTILSGARGTILAVSVILVLVVVHRLFTRPAGALRVALLMGVLAGAAWFAATIFWPDTLAAFGERFEAADRVEDTGGRLFEQAFGFLDPTRFSLFGVGIGGATLVGVSLGSGTAWVEIESMRWVTELGMIGLALSVARLVCAVVLVAAVFRRMRQSSPMVVALVGVIAPTLIYGSIGQNPSYQGAFGVSVALLMVAVTSPRAPEGSPARARASSGVALQNPQQERR